MGQRNRPPKWVRDQYKAIHGKPYPSKPPANKPPAPVPPGPGRWTATGRTSSARPVDHGLEVTGTPEAAAFA